MSLSAIFAALAADEAALAELWRELSSGICVYDPEGRPLSHNRAFDHLTGSAPADSPLAPLLARALIGETVSGAPVRWATDAGPQQLQVAALPVRHEGRVVAAVMVVTDTSPGAGQRETLGIVGHDLRNPLAAIRMTAQLLGKPDEMAADRRLVLSKRILTSATRMDAIVKSLVDYSKAKAGALVTLEREPVDLATLAARVIEEQTANLTGRSVELRSHGDVTGHWDPGRLEQILGQLISNAVRHGGEGASVMTLTNGGDHVNILMESRGPTIPPELLPHIFDPFQIGPRPEGTPRRNIGLGLFVVKELATAHGGKVAVESGEGATRFTVTLPRGVTAA